MPWLLGHFKNEIVRDDDDVWKKSLRYPSIYYVSNVLDFLDTPPHHHHININTVKFIYCEKATKFEKISHFSKIS